MKQKILDIITIILCLIFVIGICICIPRSCAANLSKKSNPVIFEFSNVDSCAWNNNCFLIWYDDADAFDYDAMADRAGLEKWYGDYIQVDLQDSLVSEFLQDWGNYTELRKNFKDNWEEMDKLSEKWGVMEIHLSNGDIRFELIKLPSNFNWWE